MEKKEKKSDEQLQTVQTVQTENVQSSSYSMTPKGKEAFMKIIENKPFNAVINIMPLVEKETLTEEEANILINFLGGYPFAEVHSFFNDLQENIVLNDKK